MDLESSLNPECQGQTQDGPSNTQANSGGPTQVDPHMFITSQNLIIQRPGFTESVTDPSQTDSLMSQTDSDIHLAVTSHSQVKPDQSYVYPGLIQTGPYVTQTDTNLLLNGSGYTQAAPCPTDVDPHVFQTAPNFIQDGPSHTAADASPSQLDLDVGYGASSFDQVDPFQTHVNADVSGPTQAKCRRIRGLFQMVPESMSSAEKRKLFVQDFTDHMNELAGQIFVIDGTVKKQLEVSVFGTALTGAEIDAAEIKLKKHIIALQKHNITNVITGAVPIRCEATMAEAAAYFRLRECISAINMSMKWEDRIRRYVTISHLGYAKHVIKNLGPVFEVLDNCTKAISTIWDPIEADASPSQSVVDLDLPKETKRSAVARFAHAPHQKSKLTKLMDKLEIKRTPSRVTRKRIKKNRRRNQLTRDDEKVAIPTAVNQKIYIRYDGSGSVSESRKDSRSPGTKRGKSRSSRRTARRNKAKLQAQIHQDETTHGEIVHRPVSQMLPSRRSSLSTTSVDGIPNHQQSIAAPDQAIKTKPDPDSERETKRHFSFSGLKGDEAPKDITSRASSPSDQSDQEKITTDDHSAMRILEARLYYFQLICTKFLQTLAEISEKLKDPSQIWYKDTQYENIFVDKIDAIIRSMPDKYLLKPLGVVRKRLEEAIMNFGGIIAV